MKQLSSSEIAKVVEELQVLVGARVNKIYQPDSHELLIKLYKKEDKYSLRIISGKAAFLTQYAFENPSPPALCLRLRKLLDHAKVEAIKQHETDRIIEFIFVDKVLIAELFGQGNFVVTDKDYNVLAAARKIDGKYAFPDTQKVEIRLIKTNISEELDALYSSGKVVAPKEPKGVKKLKNIIEKQEASASENEKRSEDAKQKGDLIYLHYAEVKEVIKDSKGLSKSICLGNVDLKLNLKKSAEQNAAAHYDEAKKLKKKAIGARSAAEEAKRKLSSQQIVEKKVSAPKKVEKKATKWFEKFHWFYTSFGSLAVGGRDAVSNEVLVKKYVEKGDYIFHTDMEGSPFFVLRTPQESDINEVATATVSYSRSWRSGYGSADAYWVKPDQVKKEGSVGKGTFLIYGSKNHLRSVPLELAIGFTDQIIGGPVKAISSQCKNYVTVKPGSDKTSDVAKKIIATLHIDKSYLDEVIKFLPAGKSSIAKR